MPSTVLVLLRQFCTLWLLELNSRSQSLLQNLSILRKTKLLCVALLFPASISTNLSKTESFRKISVTMAKIFRRNQIRHY